jgi:hypothetical protein
MSSPLTKLQLSIKSELCQISQELCQEATNIQHTMEEMHLVRKLLTRIAELLTMEDYAITSYEFRNSRLLFALELLLTKSPTQAKRLLDIQKSADKGEELKQSENAEDPQTLTTKESECLIYRFKLLAHILLIKRNKHSSLSPMRSLIDLNHKLISENDSFLLSGQSGPSASGMVPSGHSTISSLFS